jgi:hypothetical protein
MSSTLRSRAGGKGGSALTFIGQPVLTQGRAINDDEALAILQKDSQPK